MEKYNVLKENIINRAFFSVFKSINQNSNKDLNHTLGLTLSAPGLVQKLQLTFFYECLHASALSINKL